MAARIIALEEHFWTPELIALRRTVDQVNPKSVERLGDLGALRLREGQLEDAKFQIDMKSLACDDIKDAETNQMLVRHLSSDDFFDVAKYPIANFR